MSSAPELLLDENLSWRVARGLRAEGYVVVTSADARLTSLADEAVFRYAQSRQMVIVTRDSDFLTRFGPPHAGIIVVIADSRARNNDLLHCLITMLPTALQKVAANLVLTLDC